MLPEHAQASSKCQEISMAPAESREWLPICLPRSVPVMAPKRPKLQLCDV
jgi:hypothetical protein